MTLYSCMSIAGSIPVIVCLILWGVQKQAYHFHFGRKLLLTGMFFYLIPFQEIKYIFPKRVISVLSPPINIHREQDYYKVESIKSFLSPGDSVWIPRWLSILLAAWLFCIIVFAVYQVVRYRMDIRKLLSQSEKRLVKVEGKTVELFCNKHISSPYTVGFLRPVIIVPEDCVAHPCFSMVYRHEEQHRKNHDSLMKLICIIIICIHWLNPITILLLILYGITAEYVCDAQAAEGCTEEEKKTYLKLLVSLSTEGEPLSVVWRNNLSGSEKLMKRRINYMMKKRKTGWMRTGMAIAALVVTVFASTSTILAYEPLLSTDVDAVEVFVDNEFGAFLDDGGVDSVDFSASDAVFMYEDGTQVPVIDEVAPRALCIHDMVSGYYHAHKSNGSGGCRVNVYYAQKCTKCGYLDIGDLYVTNIYPVCPHK